MDITAKPGDDRTLGKLDFFVPLAQTDDALLFADLRGVLADDPSQEGNFGLGFRRIQRNGDGLIGDWLWGVYGFFDRRHSENNFYYSQGTFGAELLGEYFDLRANVYVPQGRANVVDSRQSSVEETELSGTQVIVSRANIDLQARERALPGFDLEAGCRLPLAQNHDLWAYGGYFRFDHSETPVVEGPRFRLEYRWDEPFGWEGSRLSLGGEIQHDDIRGEQKFALLELRIPLGAKSSSSRRRLKGIERRMTEQIVRDIDIVAFAEDINKPVGSEGGPIGTSEASTTPVTDSDGGQVNVYFVQQGGSGDCTQANPCDLATMNSDAQYSAGDAVVLLDAGGAILANITLQDRQQLTGAGNTGSCALTLGDMQAQLDLTGLGGRAQLNGGAGTAVTLANDTQVSCFDISGGAIGIGISGASDGANVNDLNISGATVGVSAGAGGSGTVTFQNNVAISSGAGSGLQLSGGTSTLNFAGDITGDAGAAFAATGGSNTLNYTGSLVNDSGRLIDVSGGANSMTFSGTTSANGGTGIAIANSSGSLDFNSAVNIANATGAGIQIGANMGTVAFNGTTTVSGSAGTAIDLSGSTGMINFADVDITNLGGVTGVSTAGASGAVAMASLDITGTGAANSTGVDITGSTGSFTVTNAGTIQNVVTGFELDSLGTGTTNSTLSYQNGTIDGGVPVNTVGITSGTYDFIGSTITKNSALSTATGFASDFWFVDRTGGGAGTSVDRASIDFVETNSASNDIIVLVEDGTGGAGNIIATNGLQLQNDQQLIGFAAGPARVDFTGNNAQVLGSFQYDISDPTGNGAATLTNSGGTEVVTLADNTRLRDFDLTTTGAVDGIAGNGFTGATINNIAIANAGAEAFDFTNAAGTISVTDSSATNSTGAGLFINGGNATVALNNFDVSDTGSFRSLDISATTGGSVTFDANSSISNSGGTGILINNIGGDVTFNGAVSVTAATNTAIEASTLNGNTVAFNAGLGTVSTTSGTALLASGGVLNIAGTTTINATTAQGLSLSNLTVDNGSGGALSFDTVTSTGGANGIALTNVNASNGLTVTSATLANNTTAGLNVNGVSGTLNIAAANIDANAAGTGVAIAGANGTVNVGSGGTGLDIDGGTTGVSINQASGTVNLGTGASGVFAVDSTNGVGVTLAGAGTVNIGTGGGTASIGTTTDTGGTAFAASGGTVNANYAGSIDLASNVGLLSVQGGHSGTLTFSGALSNSAATTATQLDFNNADGTYNFDGTVSADTTGGTGVGIDIAATSGGTIDFDNSLTLATAAGNAIQMDGTGSLDVSGGSLDIDTTTGTGLSQSAGTVALSDTTSIRASSSGTGINASGGSLAVASGAGTAEVISTSGQGLLLSGVTTGTGGVTFDTVNAGGGANGIALTNVTAATGLTVTSATLTNTTTAGLNVNGVTGSLNIAAANVDAGAAATGVSIAGANGTLTIGSGGTGLDIDGGTTGVSINQASGTVNLGTGATGVFAVDGSSGTGVTLAGAGTVNIGTGGAASIGATTTTTGTAFGVSGGNATVSYAGTISNTSGRLLDVTNTTGGSVTLSGGVKSDSGSGIRVQSAMGNVSISNADLTQANATSVILNGNSGDFTMTNGSVINSGATGIAVQIDNTSGAIAFNGTNLTQISGRLIDIGATTGPTAGTVSFSGGTLTNSAGTGIRVQNTAADVSIDGDTEVNSITDAVTLTNNTGSFTLTNSDILGTTGTGILASDTGDLTFDNVRVDSSSGSGISLTNVSGTVNVLNGRIDTNTGTGLLISATDGSDANVTVNGNLFIDDELTVITSNVSSEVCLAAVGNFFFSTGDPSDINLTETAGTLRVPGAASDAALSAANGGVMVNTTGGVGYGEACTIP